MKERAYMVAKRWEITCEALLHIWEEAELPLPPPHPWANISAGQVATLREIYARWLMNGMLVCYRTQNGLPRPYEPWEWERGEFWIRQWFMEKYIDLREQFAKNRSKVMAYPRFAS